MAVLKIDGNTPDDKELLIMVVSAGKTASMHSRNSGVGIGSSSHVLGAHFPMIVRRESVVIGSNDEK